MPGKTALSVPQLERLLVAAAQNWPGTADVVDVRITPRGDGDARDWMVAHWQCTGTHAAATQLRDVANRLRQVFSVSP